MPGHILFVINNPSLIRRLQQGLQPYLLRIEQADVAESHAPDRSQAYHTLVRSRQPDALILDVDLPDMDAAVLCHALKADPTTTHIPIILLTEQTEPARMRAMLQAGARDYVLKDGFVVHNLVKSLQHAQAV